MSARWYIEQIAGGKWLAPNGYVKDQERAYSFDTEVDARAYGNKHLAGARFNVVTLEQAEDRTGRFSHAETEYDPFGLRS